MSKWKEVSRCSFSDLVRDLSIKDSHLHTKDLLSSLFNRSLNLSKYNSSRTDFFHSVNEGTCGVMQSGSMTLLVIKKPNYAHSGTLAAGVVARRCLEWKSISIGWSDSGLTKAWFIWSKTDLQKSPIFEHDQSLCEKEGWVSPHLGQAGGCLSPRSYKKGM